MCEMPTKLRIQKITGTVCCLCSWRIAVCPAFFTLLLGISAAFAEQHNTTFMLLDAPINATWAANHAETWL